MSTKALGVTNDIFVLSPLRCASEGHTWKSGECRDRQSPQETKASSAEAKKGGRTTVALLLSLQRREEPLEIKQDMPSRVMAGKIQVGNYKERERARANKMEQRKRDWKVGEEGQLRTE
eukprot:1644283-Pleurochrysis_carterae.AAC.1